MDKPKLLEAIQQNHPTTSLARIQELANKEYFRQIDESIMGMLFKKTHQQLIELIAYKPTSHKHIVEENILKCRK